MVWAPAAAMRRTMASPAPWVPPVMRTRLPENSRGSMKKVFGSDPANGVTRATSTGYSSVCRAAMGSTWGPFRQGPFKLGYRRSMTRAHPEVGNLPAGQYREPTTPEAAADAVERALKYIEGRWKLVILFRLFGGRVLRFS